MTYEPNEPFLETHVSVPKIFVRNTRDRFRPDLLVSNFRIPVVADMLLNQITQRRRNPGRSMNTVRDVSDRDLFERFTGKKFLPECPRNFAVLAAHAVSRA